MSTELDLAKYETPSKKQEKVNTDLASLASLENKEIAEGESALSKLEKDLNLKETIEQKANEVLKKATDIQTKAFNKKELFENNLSSLTQKQKGREKESEKLGYLADTETDVKDGKILQRQSDRKENKADRKDDNVQKLEKKIGKRKDIYDRSVAIIGKINSIKGGNTKEMEKIKGEQKEVIKNETKDLNIKINTKINESIKNQDGVCNIDYTSDPTIDGNRANELKLFVPIIATISTKQIGDKTEQYVELSDGTTKKTIKLDNGKIPEDRNTIKENKATDNQVTKTETKKMTQQDAMTEFQNQMKGLDKNIDSYIKQNANAIVGMLETLRSIFSTFGINIDSLIPDRLKVKVEELYEKKFALNKEQKTFLDNISKGYKVETGDKESEVFTIISFTKGNGKDKPGERKDAEWNYNAEKVGQTLKGQLKELETPAKDTKGAETNVYSIDYNYIVQYYPDVANQLQTDKIEENGIEKIRIIAGDKNTEGKNKDILEKLLPVFVKDKNTVGHVQEIIQKDARKDAPKLQGKDGKDVAKVFGLVLLNGEYAGNSLDKDLTPSNPNQINQEQVVKEEEKSSKNIEEQKKGFKEIVNNKEKLNNLTFDNIIEYQDRIIQLINDNNLKKMTNTYKKIKEVVKGSITDNNKLKSPFDISVLNGKLVIEAKYFSDNRTNNYDIVNNESINNQAPVKTNKNQEVTQNVVNNNNVNASSDKPADISETQKKINEQDSILKLMIENGSLIKKNITFDKIQANKERFIDAYEKGIIVEGKTKQESKKPILNDKVKEIAIGNLKSKKIEGVATMPKLNDDKTTKISVVDNKLVIAVDQFTQPNNLGYYDIIDDKFEKEDQAKEDIEVKKTEAETTETNIKLKVIENGIKEVENYKSFGGIIGDKVVELIKNCNTNKEISISRESKTKGITLSDGKFELPDYDTPITLSATFKLGDKYIIKELTKIIPGKKIKTETSENGNITRTGPKGLENPDKRTTELKITGEKLNREDKYKEMTKGFNETSPTDSGILKKEEESFFNKGQSFEVIKFDNKDILSLGSKNGNKGILETNFSDIKTNSKDYFIMNKPNDDKKTNDILVFKKKPA